MKRRMRPVPTVQWVVLAWTVCLEKIGFEFFCSVDLQCQGPALKAFLDFTVEVLGTAFGTSTRAPAAARVGASALKAELEDVSVFRSQQQALEI